MAIEKMRLLRLAGSSNNIEDILLTAFASGDLHGELANHVINEGNGGVLLKDDSNYEQYLNRIESIARSLHIELKNKYDASQQLNDGDIEACLMKVEASFEKINEQNMNFSHLTKEDKQAIETLREYDFTQLCNCEYVSLNFGRLPITSASKLATLDSDKFITVTLNKNHHYEWVLIATLKSYKKEVDAMFESLYLEEIALPQVDDQKLLEECTNHLEEIYGFVFHNSEVRKFYKYIALFEDQCVITGFVPTSKLKAFKTQFKDMQDVIIQDFPADAEEGLEPPTKLRNNWFAKPFELFIEMYGLPHYFDFDPTFYVAITYSLLFGIMFGDLGQGLLLAIGGFFLEMKKKNRLGAIVGRIGIFSMVFGAIYGSVFGNEEILIPVFRSIGIDFLPIHVMNPSLTMTLLITACGLGAFLILTSIGLNIYGKLRRKNYAEAIFSQNGVCGFVFYGSILGGVALQMGLGIQVVNPITIGLCIALPLICILMHVPLQNLVNKIAVTPHEGWGGYIVESIFELLEVCLSFVTNTMSFLRVGGFILSHAGMMLVVMSLKDMTGSAGIVVLIFGNLFVMGLEGLIVGIQALRLEYYEMFSRYFEGGGKKYIPTAVKYE